MADLFGRKVVSGTIESCGLFVRVDEMVKIS